MPPKKLSHYQIMFDRLKNFKIYTSSRVICIHIILRIYVKLTNIRTPRFVMPVTIHVDCYLLFLVFFSTYRMFINCSNSWFWYIVERAFRSKWILRGG